MRFPWQKPEPEPEEHDEYLRDMQSEKAALARDLNQVKAVNYHLLLRALARGWLDEDQAEVIRAIQTDWGRTPPPTLLTPESLSTDEPSSPESE